MEELREQPTVEPATASNLADTSVASDVGSQNLGKFKDAGALLEAYNNLQSEFTRKCQLLKSLQKDKVDQAQEETGDETNKNSEIFEENASKNMQNEENFAQTGQLQSPAQESEDNNQEDYLRALSQFLDENQEAKAFETELKEQALKENRIKNPFEDAWAKVVLSHLKENKTGDPIINQYVLSNEGVKNQIIENYLTELTKSRPPLVISTQGEKVSGVLPDSPRTLDEAKRIVNNMFS